MSTIIELVNKIKSRELKSVDVVKHYIDIINDKKEYNAVIEVFDDALDIAKSIDERLDNGEELGKLAGVPIVIKDNILYKGKIAGCASKFMQEYHAEYNSTVVNKLISEGAVIIGRANMDEFAMGGSTEKSVYGPCLNALDKTRVPGGSSGGSACAVAGGMTPCALGTDTGGSIRQPSSFNGIVGIKPTYGRVSRFGIVAFASSLDQVGPITNNVADNAYMLSILAGYDENDGTSLKAEVPNYMNAINQDIKGVKIGICNQVKALMKDSKAFDEAVEWFESQGAEIINVDIKDIELCLPVYYILAPAEASSNLGRFDGVKYTRRSKDAKTLEEIYSKSRSEGFGAEVQRRIMLGNFVLSSGYYDAYYVKAKKVQQAVKKQFKEAFSKCDCIIMPTTLGEAYKIGSITNPVDMYLEDIFTIPANIAGIPSINIPYAKGPNGLPLGLQVMAKELNEMMVYRVADYFEKNHKEN